MCAAGETHSVVSVLNSGCDRIDEIFEHPIFRFLGTRGVRELRRVCVELNEAVASTPWRDEASLVVDPARWRECFPAAKSVLLRWSHFPSLRTPFGKCLSGVETLIFSYTESPREEEDAAAAPALAAVVNVNEQLAMLGPSPRILRFTAGLYAVSAAGLSPLTGLEELVLHCTLEGEIALPPLPFLRRLVICSRGVRADALDGTLLEELTLRRVDANFSGLGVRETPLSSLRRLTLIECTDDTSIDVLVGGAALEELEVWACPRIVSLPGDTSKLHTLFVDESLEEAVKNSLFVENGAHGFRGDGALTSLRHLTLRTFRTLQGMDSFAHVADRAATEAAGCAPPSALPRLESLTITSWEHSLFRCLDLFPHITSFRVMFVRGKHYSAPFLVPYLNNFLLATEKVLSAPLFLIARAQEIEERRAAEGDGSSSSGGGGGDVQRAAEGKDSSSSSSSAGGGGCDSSNGGFGSAPPRCYSCAPPPNDSDEIILRAVRCLHCETLPPLLSHDVVVREHLADPRVATLVRIWRRDPRAQVLLAETRHLTAFYSMGELFALVPSLAMMAGPRHRGRYWRSWPDCPMERLEGEYSAFCIHGVRDRQLHWTCCGSLDHDSVCSEAFEEIDWCLPADGF